MYSRHSRLRPTTIRRSVALLACAGLTAAACGGDDDDADLTVPDVTDTIDVTDTTAPTETQPESTMSETTAPMPSEPMTSEPMTSEPMTSEPMTSEPMDSTPPTSDMAGQGIDCAMSEQGDPLDPQALAEMDPATALGNIDGASTFLFVANEADLIDRLESDDELTFLVPTDDAFDKIPEDELQELLSNPLELSSLVQAHMVTGRYTSDDLEDGTTLPTAVEGQEWLVNVSEDGQIMIAGSDATVVCPDIETANAVIHLVDEVIITRAGIG